MTDSSKILPNQTTVYNESYKLRIEYVSHDHPTLGSKVHKAEEKLFSKVTVLRGRSRA